MYPQLAYYYEHRDYKLQYQKEYYQKNKDWITKYYKSYYQKNKIKNKSYENQNNINCLITPQEKLYIKNKNICSAKRINKQEKRKISIIVTFD